MAVPQPEFVLNPLLVGVYGLGADVQLVANFWRRVALRHVPEHVTFTRGEFLKTRAVFLERILALIPLGECARRFGSHVQVATGDRTHRVHHFAIGRGLEHITAGAGFHQRHHIFLFGVHRHDEHARGEFLGDNQLGGFMPVHRPHRQIHDDDVWVQSLGQRHSVGTIGGFPHHIEVAFLAEDCFETGANHGVVVNENDANQVARHRCVRG